MIESALGNVATVDVGLFAFDVFKLTFPQKLP